MAANEKQTGRHADFDLETAIHNLPDKFIECRDYSHAWRKHDAYFDNEARCYVLVLKCTRCRTERHRNIGRGGELMGSKYTYVEGYTIQGMGRITADDRATVRLESVTRAISGSPVQKAKAS